MNKPFKGVLTALIALITIGCSSSPDDVAKPIADPEIESFSVFVDGKEISADIDQTKREVTITGIRDFDKIERVSAKTPDGTTLTPSPSSFLKNWERENKITANNGKKRVSYTISFPNAVENTLIVNVNDRKQQIRFIGGDMERSAAHMQNAQTPVNVAKLAFGDIPFSICRVSFDRKQEEVEGTKNMAFYAKPVQSMKDIRSVNPNIEFWATLKSDYDGYGDNSNLPSWICSYPTSANPKFFHTDKYAIFLADYLEHMQNEGVGISYMSVAKEWSAYITADRTIAIIKSLKEECTKRGITIPKFTDPASWSVSQGISFVNSMKSKNALPLFYGFSTHDYNSNDTKSYKDFINAVNACGGSYFPFQDETGSGAGSRMTTTDPDLEMPNLDGILNVYSAKAAMYRDGMAGELIFEPFSRGVASERRAIYFKGGEAPSLMRAYFCLKEFVSCVTPTNDRPNLEYPDGLNPESKYFVSSENDSRLPDFEMMSFANDTEIAVCLINKNDKTVNNVEIKMNGANKINSANGTLFTKDIPIRGKVMSDIPTLDNSVVLSEIPAKSIIFLSIEM